jgi:hypothetical protein
MMTDESIALIEQLERQNNSTAVRVRYHAIKKTTPYYNTWKRTNDHNFKKVKHKPFHPGPFSTPNSPFLSSLTHTPSLAILFLSSLDRNNWLLITAPQPPLSLNISQSQ